MLQQRRPIRTILAVWGAAAVCLQALPAAAQSAHHLVAQVGQSTAATTEETYDPAMTFVAVAYQNGVPGTNPEARALFASVDSVNGVLHTSGVTVNKQVANRGRAYASLEQRMFFESGGTTPVVVDALLTLNGFGAGGFIELDASLRIGNCIVGVRRYSAISELPPFASNNGCNDTAAVDWDVSSSEGALHIIATYTSKPSALNITAWTSGDLGGTVSDISDGQFSSGGVLTISSQGADAYFQSPTFLAVPEPEVFVGVMAGVLFLATRRKPRMHGRKA